MLSRLEALDDTLHAFKLVTRERALAQAQAAELALRTGQDVGPLHGIPYAAKDLFDVKGLPTTAGSHLLQDNIATADAAVVRRWQRARYHLREQLEDTEDRYEVLVGGQVVQTELHDRSPATRWYTQAQSLALCANAGFGDVCATRDFTFDPATPADRVWSVFGTRQA